MNASVVVGASATLLLENGARMPSTADEVCAEIRNPAFRIATDLRWGLDCFSFTQGLYPYDEQREMWPRRVLRGE